MNSARKKVPTFMKRVLLVEDEVLVAMYIEDLLTDLGCEVVALGTSLKLALELVNAKEFEFAVLDINLAGERSFPVAEILRQRKIPFLFVSGYSSAGLLDEYRSEVRLRKPLRTHELAQAIERLNA
jgi:CheY-like chemotaxis protein